MNSKRRSKKSLCEKSMNLVTSIVKVSYISVAKMSLGTGGPPHPQATSSLRAVVNNPTLPQFPNSLRSQEPRDSSIPVSYLIHPRGGNRSSLTMITEEENIDGKASRYIKKVRENNLSDLSEISNFSEFLLPPPPYAVLKSS